MAAQKAGMSKWRSEVTISDVRKERYISSVDAKWYMHYLRERP